MTLKKLHTMLQMALEVELFTIPPYLTALYSIEEGRNSVSVKILQSVAMEEMLHAALVSNLMNAVGAHPQVESGGKGQPSRRYYPAQVPHIARRLNIGLLPFSKRAVEDFMLIELPENRTKWKTGPGTYSIGQLYDQIRNLLVAVTEQLGVAKIFTGARSLQLSEVDYYGAGGRLKVVTDLDSALEAIAEISQQGEGRLHSNAAGDEAEFGLPKEVAHFYRFEQILEGRFYDRDDDIRKPTGPRLLVDWKAVLPVAVPGPKATPTSPPGIGATLDAFTATYEELLACLHQAFNGKKAKLVSAVPIMQRLKVQATEIMRIGIGNGQTCPPPFWFIES